MPGFQELETGGKSPKQVTVEGLKVAKAVGARSMRCVMGSMDDRRSDKPIEYFMEATIKVFVREVPGMDLGVKIAIENHAGRYAGERDPNRD